MAFPLWWALGLGTFIFVILAVPMAAALIRRDTLRVPKGFGFWLLFIAWMLLGVTMLWADAPGAVPGGGGAGRLMVFGLRAAMYLSATIVFLYVLNTKEDDLPTRRVVRLLGLMFVVTTAGGVLGVVLPHLEFTSPLELLLPGGLANNGYVNPMIHPATAEIQKVLGYEESRPIAPFSFANSWGANFSLYLPFFLLSWLGKDAGWRRPLAPVVLGLALVPVVYSLNRGLWVAIAVGAVYLAVRLALLGRVWMLQVMGATLPGLLALPFLAREAGNAPLFGLCFVPVAPALSAAVFAWRVFLTDRDLAPARHFLRGYRLNWLDVLRWWVPTVGFLSLLGFTLANLHLAGVPNGYGLLLIVVAVGALLWSAPALVLSSTLALRTRDIARLAVYYLAARPAVTLGVAALLLSAAGLVVLISDWALVLLASPFALALTSNTAPVVRDATERFT